MDYFYANKILFFNLFQVPTNSNSESYLLFFLFFFFMKERIVNILQSLGIYLRFIVFQNRIKIWKMNIDSYLKILKLEIANLQSAWNTNDVLPPSGPTYAREQIMTEWYGMLCGVHLLHHYDIAYPFVPKINK